MTCSLKQIEANRKNAQKSTGPKTPEGKERSRANGLKHGLTGAGVVVPTEDAEKLDERFAALEAELKPSGELARSLVSRVALLLIRMERSAEHEAKSIANRMRKAEAAFDDARLAEMENYYSWIAAEPATNARRLRMTPEGIKRIHAVLEDLRADLLDPMGHRWDWSRCEQLHHLIGLRRVDVPVSRARALSDAIEGNFRNLKEADGPDLDLKARQEWAVAALVDLIDGEIAKLQALNEAFDHEGLALDRAEAAHRAIFDPSPAAVLARKYEATSERGFYRALKELRDVQEIRTEVDTYQAVESEPGEEMGSSFPQPEADENGSSIVDEIVFMTIPPASEPPAEAPTGRASRPKLTEKKSKRRR